MSAAEPVASMYRFDDRAVDWKKFAAYDGFVYKLLDVNVGKRTIDMMFKFEPNGRCFYHRHVAATAALVLEGEHRILEPDDLGGHRIKVRAAGDFATSPGDEIHIEGGGNDGAIVYFSMRGDSDHIYDILDDDLNVVREVSIHDFAKALAAW